VTFSLVYSNPSSSVPGKERGTQIASKARQGAPRSKRGPVGAKNERGGGKNAGRGGTKGSKNPGPRGMEVGVSREVKRGGTPKRHGRTWVKMKKKGGNKRLPRGGKK